MANHKSAIKRIRTNQVRKARNKYDHKTARNAFRSFFKNEIKEQVVSLFPKLFAMLDKLAKKNIIHKNKAARLKSKAHSHLNTIQA